MSDPIYLDYNATTPVALEALEAFLRAVRDGWGNPSSDHVFGARAHKIVEEARESVAALVGCWADEIVFTSGGTEADHLAVAGVAEASRKRGRHVVISGIEHPAIEETCRALEARGWVVSRIGVDGSGTVRLEEMAATLRDDTALVSVMHANNETGVIQPIADIVRLAHERGITVHSDAAQSIGKIDTRIDELGVDLLTIAGHKLYATKGIGALVVRRGTPVTPSLRGGGQERGLRSGTENVPGIASLGAACALARREAAGRFETMRVARDRLEHGLRSRFPDLVVHGAGARRLPNTLSAAIPSVFGDALVARLPEVALSTGAACHAGASEPSRVLLAMGVSARTALCTVRLSTGRATTSGEIDEAVDRIAAAVERLV